MGDPAAGQAIWLTWIDRACLNLFLVQFAAQFLKVGGGLVAKRNNF
jgi:hypothetical protein